MSAGWTEERVGLLTKLWGDGLSASQIAKQLTGVTRNAVIGKVHRLGLAGRAAPSRPIKTTLVTPKPRPVVVPPVVRLVTPVEKPPVAVAPARAEAPRPRSTVGVSVLALKEGMCKWPMGDPGDADFAFCGCASKPGTPYCTEHAAVAYQPQAPRKRTNPEDRARVEAQRWQRVASR